MNRLAATSPNPEVPPVITMLFIIENGLVSAWPGCVAIEHPEDDGSPYCIQFVSICK
jgi:hypothetical protein